MSFIPKKYDPVTYWNERKQPNTQTNPGVSAENANFLRKNIGDARSLLEVGPGTGRLLGQYGGIDRVCTLDLSKAYVSQINDAAKLHGLNVEQHFLSAVDDVYPFQTKEFDVVISSYVLIHVPFTYITQALMELTRVGKKLVCIASNEPHWPSKQGDVVDSSHCFSHDYKGLCERLGLNYSDETKFGGTSIGFVCHR